jgi:hypothetical protein
MLRKKLALFADMTAALAEAPSLFAVLLLGTNSVAVKIAVAEVLQVPRRYWRGDLGDHRTFWTTASLIAGRG